jgi:hypothetical protein
VDNFSIETGLKMIPVYEILEFIIVIYSHIFNKTGPNKTILEL